MPWLGETAAAELHCRLVRHALQACAASGIAFELWGSEDHPRLRELAREFGVSLFIQAGGDLGRRMYRAIDSMLQRSASAIIIGSDCPAIDAGYLQAAVEQLQSCAWVIGPALDGGYVLIGARRNAPGVFGGVEWGSSSVLQQTRHNLLREGFVWRELQPLNDLDEPGDVVIARRQWPALFEGL